MSADERAEWEARYRSARGADPGAPEPFIVNAVNSLSARGRALDLAGGIGRHALWVAERGWDATLVDISPTAVAEAAATASRRGLRLATEVVDLDETDPSGGPWDLVMIHHYLNRTLLGRAHELLRPGGTLVVCHQTLINLERSPRPGARFLLEPKELATLLSHLQLSTYFEGWTEQGRHEAQAVASLPPAEDRVAAALR